MMPNEFHALTVIGPGAWGTALGSVVASKAVTVDTLGLESHESDWARSLPPGRLVLIATPFSAIHGILPRLKRFKISGVINASKGIDRDSLLTFTQLARKSLKCPVATLSGPTFALEVQQQKPTA